MGRDYKLVVRDDFLPPGEADFLSELARSHRYEDTKSDFSYFGAGVSDGYRIYKQIEQYTSRADASNPLMQITPGSPLHKISACALDVLQLDPQTEVTCSFVMMSNGAQHGLHIDAAYQGAFVYYVDREWTVEKGGELICYPRLTADHDDFNAMMQGKPIPQERFRGIEGVAYAPLFNRLVVIEAGLPHRVARVENYIGAGRLCLSGFVRRR